MDAGPTLAKGHPRPLGRGCNVRSTCRCSVYPAIHTTTRILLRSSSTHEPSDPPSRVVLLVVRLHEGDSIEGFETENPERKPANSGEAGGTPFSSQDTSHVGLSFGVGGRLTPPSDAPWTRRTARTDDLEVAPSAMGFDRVAVSPPLSGRSSAPDWGRPAEQEGAWNGDSVADVPQARHGTQGGSLSRLWRARRRGHLNDPSAGSPTETLLRLLLPLNDQVRTSFRQPEATESRQGRQSGALTKSLNR